LLTILLLNLMPLNFVPFHGGSFLFLDSKFLFQFLNQCGSLFSFFINFKCSFLLFWIPI
jgi:hypothetical protein